MPPDAEPPMSHPAAVAIATAHPEAAGKSVATVAADLGAVRANLHPNLPGGPAPRGGGRGWIFSARRDSMYSMIHTLALVSQKGGSGKTNPCSCPRGGA